MKKYCLLIAMLMIARMASAQSAIERHIWQDAQSFSPISRTAEAITGAITLSGNDKFATEGSTMRMTFSNGASVELTSVGASWRNWNSEGSQKQNAETFRLSKNPGPLKNGNTLCGADEQNRQLYAVFSEYRLFGGPLSLNLAIFQSDEPPFDINSAGLCGTFSYETEH